MADGIAPGVYVEELPVRVRDIPLVHTHTAAFVGPTRRGPLGAELPLLTSLADFERVYGGPQPLLMDDGSATGTPQVNHVAHAARAFFANGGARLYVARTACGAVAAQAALGTGDTPATRIVVHAGTPGRLGNGRVVLRERHSPVALRSMTRGQPGTLLRTVNATGEVECLCAADGSWRDRSGARVVRGRVGVSRVVTLEIDWADAEGQGAQSWSGLALSRLHPRWLGAQLPHESALAGRTGVWVELGEAVDTWALLDALRAGAPAPGDAIRLPLAGGTDGTPAPLGDAAEAGSYAAGLAELARLDDVRTVAAPGASARADRALLQAALVAHAAQCGAWRVAVLDPAPGASAHDVRVQRAEFGSSHAALYWPWLVVPDPLAPAGAVGVTVAVPPSGAVAGLYARSDVARGPHRAPANEPVLGAVRVELPVTQGEQELLNPLGVNCFREFIGRGLLLWGARLASTDPEWKYVNLRRWCNAVEASLQEGLRWVAFEPNGPRLWATLAQSIDGFMQDQWRNGALAGARADEAWFVRCDRSTMTQQDIDAGRVVCEIGAALMRPAEFRILRWSGLSADARQPNG